MLDIPEESIERDAGLSPDESKTRHVARSALPEGEPTVCGLRFYRAIRELIAGYRLMFLHSPG